MFIKPFEIYRSYIRANLVVISFAPIALHVTFHGVTTAQKLATDFSHYPIVNLRFANTKLDKSNTSKQKPITRRKNQNR